MCVYTFTHALGHRLVPPCTDRITVTHFSGLLTTIFEFFAKNSKSEASTAPEGEAPYAKNFLHILNHLLECDHINWAQAL